MSFDLMTRHYFSGREIAKRMEIPAGHYAISHKHKYDHLSILAEGKALVICDGEEKIFTAPECITIKAGVNHEIHALEDVTWFCVHATSETDESKIDQVLIMEESPCL